MAVGGRRSSEFAALGFSFQSLTNKIYGTAALGKTSMYMYLFVNIQLNENAVGGGVRWVQSTGAVKVSGVLGVPRVPQISDV